jgi:hypothetical protein
MVSVSSALHAASESTHTEDYDPQLTSIRDDFANRPFGHKQPTTTRSIPITQRSVGRIRT